MLDLSLIEKLYVGMSKKHDLARQNLGRSLTLSEKILFGHLINLDKVPKRGKSYVELQPDRVAMQDATAQVGVHLRKVIMLYCFLYIIKLGYKSDLSIKMGWCMSSL